MWQKSLQGRCTTATTGENDAGVTPVDRQPYGLLSQHTHHRLYGSLYPQPKPVPIYTAWWTEARVWTTCPELHLAAEQPGIELATSQSLIRRPTRLHYQATWVVCEKLGIGTWKKILVNPSVTVSWHVRTAHLWRSLWPSAGRVHLRESVWVIVFHS